MFFESILKEGHTIKRFANSKKRSDVSSPSYNGPEGTVIEIQERGVSALTTVALETTTCDNSKDGRCSIGDVLFYATLTIVNISLTLMILKKSFYPCRRRNGAQTARVSFRRNEIEEEPRTEINFDEYNRSMDMGALKEDEWPCSVRNYEVFRRTEARSGLLRPITKPLSLFEKWRYFRLI